jgi:hypothetical protein
MAHQKTAQARRGLWSSFLELVETPREEICKVFYTMTKMIAKIAS